MAGDAFQKFKDSTSRAITKISVKTSSSLEKSKIKMHIDSLNKDIQKMTLDIGRDVYSLWKQGIDSTQSLTEKMQEIQQKEQQIDQLAAQLDSIDERDSEILGETKESPVEEAVQSKPVCPSCGYAYEAAAKFCRKCGYKLL